MATTMRLQVRVLPPNAAPAAEAACSFLEVVDPSQTLEGLSISIIRRHNRLYPHQPALRIHKLRDAECNDLDLEYRVSDVFTDKSDNKADSIVQVIQSPGFREPSLPLDSALHPSVTLDAQDELPVQRAQGHQPQPHKRQKRDHDNDTRREDARAEHGGRSQRPEWRPAPVAEAPKSTQGDSAQQLSRISDEEADHRREKERPDGQFGLTREGADIEMARPRIVDVRSGSQSGDQAKAKVPSSSPIRPRQALDDRGSIFPATMPLSSQKRDIPSDHVMDLSRSQDGVQAKVNGREVTGPTSAKSSQKSRTRQHSASGKLAEDTPDKRPPAMDTPGEEAPEREQIVREAAEADIRNRECDNNEKEKTGPRDAQPTEREPEPRQQRKEAAAEKARQGTKQKVRGEEKRLQLEDQQTPGRGKERVQKSAEPTNTPRERQNAKEAAQRKKDAKGTESAKKKQAAAEARARDAARKTKEREEANAKRKEKAEESKRIRQEALEKDQAKREKERKAAMELQARQSQQSKGGKDTQNAKDAHRDSTRTAQVDVTKPRPSQAAAPQPQPEAQSKKRARSPAVEKQELHPNTNAPNKRIRTDSPINHPKTTGHPPNPTERDIGPSPVPNSAVKRSNVKGNIAQETSDQKKQAIEAPSQPDLVSSPTLAISRKASAPTPVSSQIKHTTTSTRKGPTAARNTPATKPSASSKTSTKRKPANKSESSSETDLEAEAETGSESEYGSEYETASESEVSAPSSARPLPTPKAPARVATSRRVTAAPSKESGKGSGDEEEGEYEDEEGEDDEESDEEDEEEEEEEEEEEDGEGSKDSPTMVRVAESALSSLVAKPKTATTATHVTQAKARPRAMPTPPASQTYRSLADLEVAPIPVVDARSSQSQQTQKGTITNSQRQPTKNPTSRGESSSGTEESESETSESGSSESGSDSGDEEERREIPSHKKAGAPAKKRKSMGFNFSGVRLQPRSTRFQVVIEQRSPAVSGSN